MLEVGSADDQHGAFGVAADLLRGRAQEPTPGPGPAAVAQHDQVGSVGTGRSQDLGGMAGAEFGGQSHPEDAGTRRDHLHQLGRPLASIVSGLTEVPVVAVPTSAGQGASAFGGFSALLTMLNSASPGVVVSNIDNGHAAGVFAARIARRTLRG